MSAKKSVSTGRTGTSKAALKVPKTYDKLRTNGFRAPRDCHAVAIASARNDT